MSIRNGILGAILAGALLVSMLIPASASQADGPHWNVDEASGQTCGGGEAEHATTGPMLPAFDGSRSTALMNRGNHDGNDSQGTACNQDENANRGGGGGGDSSPPRSCSPVPHLCGYPDATNTGVPAGTTLTRVTGDLIITTDGAVVDGLLVDSGAVGVEANNVTIKRTKVLTNGSWGIVQMPGFTNLTIEDTEVARKDTSTTTSCPPNGFAGSLDNAISLRGYNTPGVATLVRVNLHDSTTGVHIEESGVTIRDSYIHDLVDISGCDHNDAILSNGDNSGGLIWHNTLQVPFAETSPLALFPDFGAMDNYLVAGNLLNGGGYCTYAGGGDSSHPDSTNMRFIANLFGKLYFPSCGQYGPVRAFATGAVGNCWSWNFWDGDFSAVTVPNAAACNLSGMSALVHGGGVAAGSLWVERRGSNQPHGDVSQS